MKKGFRRTLLACGIFMMMISFTGMSLAADKGLYPNNITFVAGSVGGTYYFIGTGIGKVINDKFEGVNCSVEVTSSAPLENAYYVSRTEETVGIITMDGITDALAGNEKVGFKQPITNVRVIMGGHVQYNHVGVKKGRGIKTIADLKGKTIGTVPVGSSARQQLEAALILQGLDPKKDLRLTPLSYPEQVDAMKDSKVDAFHNGGGVPSVMAMEIANTDPITIVTIPEDLEKKMLEKYPFWGIGTIPAGTYNGQDEDAKVSTVQTLIFCNDALSEQFIYDLMGVVFANTEFMKTVHAEGKNWNWETTLEFYKKRQELPWHPGAVKYIKERAGL